MRVSNVLWERERERETAREREREGESVVGRISAEWLRDHCIALGPSHCPRGCRLNCLPGVWSTRSFVGQALVRSLCTMTFGSVNHDPAKL